MRRRLSGAFGIRLRVPLLVVAFVGGSLQAHDFWIEPGSFMPDPGTTVPLYLLVGDHFNGELFPRSTAHIAEFTAQTPMGRLAVDGFEGQSPAGYLAAASGGDYVIGYRSRRSYTTMELAEFRDYLREEGLDAVLQHESVREGAKPTRVREAFSRCAKSLVTVGETPGERSDSRLGLRLELVAKRNPTQVSAGEWIEVEVLFEGEPLPNALITGRPKKEPAATSSARSDARGVARIQITQPGIWMVKTVHMITAEEGLEADWESLWASLTFEIRDSL